MLIAKELVTVKLCTGLIGVCVIAIIGDETDGVHADICQTGTQEWFDRLPENSNYPIEGVFDLEMNVSFYEENNKYEIINIIPKLQR